MGIGSSFSFFYGKGKDSGDADVQIVNKRQPVLDKKDASKDAGAEDTPQTIQGQDGPMLVSDFYAKAMDMTPRERAATLGSVPAINYVMRERNSQPRASNYSPSPIKTSQTSPCSFKISSESVLAYPSPTRLHSPIVSYANAMNRVSPIQRPAPRPRVQSLSPERSPVDDGIKKDRASNFFFCNIPSPSWKPLTQVEDSDDKTPSLSPDRAWDFSSSHWNHIDMEGRPSRKIEQTYYQDEDGQCSVRSHREKRYF